jgi:N-acetylneuraminic acid mutarotase
VTVGGSAAGATTATSETRTYNPITDTLTVLATDPWPGNVGGTVLPGGGAVFNNKLYVFGGFNINVSMTTQIWQFDPAAAAGTRWTLKGASVPAPGLGYIPTATSGNFIYLLGGSAFDPTLLLVDSNSSLRYDPVADAITTIATIPRATAETRAVTEPNDGSIYVLSGGRTAPNPTTQVDVYRPGTNTWTTAPPILTARRNFPADVQSTDGRIWAVGGYAPAAASAVNEQFTCVVPVDLITFGVE